MDKGVLLVAMAMLFALATGFCIGRVLWAWLRRRRPAEILRREAESYAWLAEAARRGPVDLILRYAEQVTKRLALRSLPSGGPVFRSCSRSDEQVLLRAAGLGSKVSSDGMKRARLELSLGLTLCGAVLGACLSGMLLAAFAVGGFLAGLRLPSWALAKRVQERAEDAERHLPEMLDVISLGLRSGLSFDAALDAYCDHFATLLSREMREAKDQWERSLVTRDEALANVAALFDSPSLRRVLGDISRSLKYGSALTGSLETVAVQVRKEYRARKEEEVAKAPVKMMVPTGVLILPAMLILVLGPVMLELMAGF